MCPPAFCTPLFPQTVPALQHGRRGVARAASVVVHVDLGPLRRRRLPASRRPRSRLVVPATATATATAAPGAPRPYTAVMLVPTGVGAAVGGYAGDALPAARLLASVADRLVTHPNVLNGALMYWPMPNALYVEGLALDAFAAGHVALRPPHPPANAVALVLDKGLSPDAVARHLHAADAARATLGLRVTSYVVTDAPLGVELRSNGSPRMPADVLVADEHNKDHSGGQQQPPPPTATASWGTIRRPDALLRACAAAVDAGADALAIVAKFPDDEDPDALAAYRAGSGIDPIAGAEAVISHLVTREIGVPCAHAPALPPLDADPSVAPKSAAEELGYTFLSCVLVGLSAAPHLISLDDMAATAPSLGCHLPGLVTVEDVNAVVVPVDAFGGAAVMSLAARPDVLVVAVKANTTSMTVPPQAVGIHPSRVLYAASYAEAAGFLAAHKAGIDIAAVGTEVPRVQRLHNVSSTPPGCGLGH